MKKILIISALLYSSLAAFAQYPQTPMQPSVPYIEVIGSAEQEIEPDEIRLSVTVGNYTDKNIQKLSLEAADKRFMETLTTVGINKDQIILKDAATNSYWTYRGNRSQENIRLEKRYELIIKSSAQLNQLLNNLPGPKEGIVNVNVTELKNKNIAEYRKEVKMRALIAAKEKATYLLESVGDKIGKTIYVEELDEDVWNQPLARGMYSNLKMEAAMDDMDAGDVQMQKIKLKYRMKARFTIH
ncbi:MAG: SIMPL domain-containing protein [Dysgonomonas sp.]|nr:SIMPL domain-containing protein [Dysgonomonas sp.]